MNPYHISMAPRLSQLLAEREAELRTILHTASDPADATADAQPRDVMDFKDMAFEEARSVVDDAQAERASAELDKLLAAQQRIQDKSYGLCLDCGEPIDLLRLNTLPASPYCAVCQAQREHARPLTARRSTLHLPIGKHP